MTRLEFDALDYRADQRFVPARYRFEGSATDGWRIHRDGVLALELGPGYRLLRTQSCGVCSTDLARQFLPFPLPQVIGHEVIATDETGQRFVVEINASHAARGVASACPFCNAGLHTHCPERIVLGIHDLPGGFGPYLLAPIHACVPIPASIPDSAAVLVEPFAAALHAVATIAPRDGERIAVLGPRRLGMLVVAALAGVRAQRRRRGGDFSIAALARDPAMLELACGFGATETHAIDDDGSALPDAAFDVVIDTTGNPGALPTALRLARREVHLKSTHGRESCGLEHLTELVVDELAIEALPKHAPAPGSLRWETVATGPRLRVAWLPQTAPPRWLTGLADLRMGDAASLAADFGQDRDGLPRADVAVVDCAAQIDAVIRPRAGREEALIRPRGSVLVHPFAEPCGSALLIAVMTRGLRLSSSRCGDFRAALALLEGDAELRRIGERLVTHRFGAERLAEAFAVAKSRACIKAVVTHSDLAAR